MAKLEIIVPKVHCIKRTDLFFKDEVFLVVIVTAGNLQDLTNDVSAPKIVFTGITPLLKLKKGEMKVFDLGEEWKADLGDAEAYSVLFGLYEHDGGDVYDAMQTEITQITEPVGFNFNDLIKEIWEKIKQNLEDGVSMGDVLSALVITARAVFKHIMKDDLIGSDIFSAHISDDDAAFIRDFKDMRGGGSKYDMQLQVKLTEL
ncbi:hypothetical protein [Flavobacterium beibuense]|uniref:hypothetical protein n=1 Tax=Flavobacterium beibuense TaxID=657326 RepID=UPI003A93DCB0